MENSKNMLKEVKEHAKRETIKKIKKQLSILSINAKRLSVSILNEKIY